MTSRDKRSSDSTPQVQDTPPIGGINWGDFHRRTPFCSLWGTTRGRPVDRYYIESFLQHHEADFRGDGVEIENSNYLRKYGQRTLDSMHILDVSDANPRATLIGDLTCPDGLPTAAFDCFVLTQTLHLIYDASAAVEQAARMLRPGGVLLATVPGIAPLPSREPYIDQFCWSFTVASITRMFGTVFGAENIVVESLGNIRSATAFLWGMALEELSDAEYSLRDPDYPVVISVRAVKT